jgi:murein DD-endopeptidase MepM/ murein hydrolase activator NlpD
MPSDNLEAYKRLSQTSTPRYDKVKVEPEETSGFVDNLALLRERTNQKLKQLYSQGTLQTPNETKPQQGGILAGLTRINQAFGNYNPSVEITKDGVNYGTDFNARVGDPVAVPPQGKWVVQEAYNDGGFNSGYGNSVIARNTETEKP